MDGEAQGLTFARSPAHRQKRCTTVRSVSHPHGEARRPGAWIVRTEQRDDAHSAGHAHFFNRSTYSGIVIGTIAQTIESGA